MAVEPILRLTSPEVLEVVSNLNSIVHTLIPDKYRLTDSNKVGLYPHPVAICIGPSGKFIFLDHSSTKQQSKVCLADFHNPVRVQILKSGLADARCVEYLSSKGVALVVERNGISMIEVEGSVGRKLSKLKSKFSAQNALKDIGLSQEVTVKVLKERIQSHLDKMKKNYKDSGKKIDRVKFKSRCDLHPK